jgi:hypothetical protein
MVTAHAFQIPLRLVLIVTVVLVGLVVIAITNGRHD